VGVSCSIMKSMRNESTGTVMLLPQRMDPDRTRGRWWGEGWCLSQATTLREPSPPLVPPLQGAPPAIQAPSWPSIPGHHTQTYPQMMVLVAFPGLK